MGKTYGYSHNLLDYILWILTALALYWFVYLPFDDATMKQVSFSYDFDLMRVYMYAAIFIAFNVAGFCTYFVVKECGEYLANVRSHSKAPTKIRLSISIVIIALIGVWIIDFCVQTYIINLYKGDLTWFFIERIIYYGICVAVWLGVNILIENAFLSRVHPKLFLR